MTELYTTFYSLTIIIWIVWGIVAIAFIFAGCLILYELLIMPIYEMICEYLDKKRRGLNDI